MKLLKQNYYIFTLLSICEPETVTSKWIRYRNGVFTFFHLFMMFVALAASITFIGLYYSVDLVNSLGAGFQVGATGAAFYTLFAAVILRTEIMKVFDDLQTIYHLQKNNKESLTAILKVDQRNEWLIEFAFKYYTVACPLSLVFECTGSAIYSYYRFGYFDSNILYRPFAFELPWDQKTFHGWIAEVMVHILAAASFTIVYPAFLIFFISICEFQNTFHEIFHLQCIEIGTMARNRHCELIEVKTAIGDLVNFHNMTKDFFKHTAQVYSTFILVQLIGGMIFLTCSIFQMDLMLQHLSLGIVLMLFAVTVSGITLFLYCYYGKYATDCQAAFALSAYESDWIHLPIELQRCFILIIANAQIPLTYHGYGIVDLNLETFAKIFKTVISYYVMFKTLTADV